MKKSYQAQRDADLKEFNPGKFNRLSKTAANFLLNPYTDKAYPLLRDAAEGKDPMASLISIFEDDNLKNSFIFDVVYNVLEKYYPERWENGLRQMCIFIVQFRINASDDSYSKIPYSKLPQAVRNLLYKKLGGKSVTDFLIEDIFKNNEIGYTQWSQIVLPVINNYFPLEYSNLYKRIKIVFSPEHGNQTKVLRFYINFHRLNEQLNDLDTKLRLESKKNLKIIKIYIEKIMDEMPKDSRALCSLQKAQCFILFEVLTYLNDGIKTNKWVSYFTLFQRESIEIGLKRLSDYLSQVFIVKDIQKLRALTERFIDTGKTVGAYLAKSNEYLNSMAELDSKHYPKQRYLRAK